MNKLIKSLIVVLSTFAISTAATAIDISIGAAYNGGLAYAEAKETNGTGGDVDTEDGVLDTSHMGVFVEAGNEMVSVGLEYQMEDIDTNEAENVTRDLAGGQGTNSPANDGTAVTNRVSATIEEMYTLYASVMIPNTSMYVKASYVQGNVATKESLGTGGSYGDEDLKGTGLGVGTKYTADNGLFVGFEGMYTEYDKITATNDNDSEKKVEITDMSGLNLSLRVGKTF